MPVVFILSKVCYYDRAAFLLAGCSAKAADFAFTETAIDYFKSFLRGDYEALYELTAGCARRRFDQMFCVADYLLLRQPGANYMLVALKTLLHERADFKILKKLAACMRDIDVPQGLQPTSPSAV